MGSRLQKGIAMATETDRRQSDEDKDTKDRVPTPEELESGDGWTKCPDCRLRVDTDELGTHRYVVHGTERRKPRDKDKDKDKDKDGKLPSPEKNKSKDKDTDGEEPKRDWWFGSR